MYLITYKYPIACLIEDQLSIDTLYILRYLHPISYLISGLASANLLPDTLKTSQDTPDISRISDISASSTLGRAPNGSSARGHDMLNMLKDISIPTYKQHFLCN